MRELERLNITETCFHVGILWYMVGQSCARLGYGAWTLMNQGFFVYEWDQDLAGWQKHQMPAH